MKYLAILEMYRTTISVSYTHLDVYKRQVVISHEASDLKSTLYDVEAFTAEDFGNTMMQELAKAMGEKGQYAQMAVSYTHLFKGALMIELLIR